MQDIAIDERWRIDAKHIVGLAVECLATFYEHNGYYPLDAIIQRVSLEEHAPAIEPLGFVDHEHWESWIIGHSILQSTLLSAMTLIRNILNRVDLLDMRFRTIKIEEWIGSTIVVSYDPF